jgi:hypothetical protein
VYDLLIVIEGGLKDTLRVDSIQVFPSNEAIASRGEPGPAVQLTTFLKEQQWKTDFRTIWVSQREISQAVRAPGEIIARKDYDVIVSAPFAGT